MKQLLIILVAYLSFVGCGTKNIKDINVIIREHRLDACNCQFDLYGNSSPHSFFERTRGAIYFIDTCSKYDIGDTVNFIK